jgi:hypothetical protein
MLPVRGLLLAAVIAALAALAAGGCATARAKAPSVPVALEAPAPPPRVIVPPEPEIPEPPVPTPEPESVAPRTPRRPPVAGPAKTEPRIDNPRATPQAPPTATLQQALPASPADIVRRVREQLGQAQIDLRRVDYRALSADGKSQYDTATRFVEQAEQALGEKNLVFAAKVAEKAAVLAASLVGRLRP